MSFCTELTLERLTLYTTVSLLLLCSICRTDATEHFVSQPMDLYEDYGFEVEEMPDRKPSFPKTIHDNGMLHLVLHYLAVKLIGEIQSEGHIELSKRQGEILHEKITGFYDEILKHPALNNNRIAFSKTKPDFAKYWPESSEDYPDNREKRTASGRLTEICASDSGWQEEVQGITRTHQVVNLHPDQHFYVTKCRNNGERCNHMSIRITSECKSRSSWTIAYVEDDTVGGYKWEWIAIETCCSCAASY
ncbi:uncharacterized protein [Asterias amurensis]|uniref:uncharacterized protein isoform X1 n=1 Tax=Asterias amurensis TaxID=7602 RepID=UPI003AB8C248